MAKDARSIGRFPFAPALLSAMLVAYISYLVTCAGLIFPPLFQNVKCHWVMGRRVFTVLSYLLRICKIVRIFHLKMHHYILFKK